jgi:alpha-galactosidase
MPSALPAQTSTLAATPPMGWNSWNLFAGKVEDKDVRAAADAMVSSGMKDAGYLYVNIDDTWQGDRDAQGNIQANSKFPDMKALADYVHSKGLKIGIYSSPGPKDLRQVRRQLSARSAGREDLCGLGHRLSQVRPLQLSPDHDAGGAE